MQFSAYDSPLFSYPLLRSRSRVKANLSVAVDELPRTVISLADRSSSESSDNPSSKLTIPNLRPLRDSVMLRQVGSAFDRRLCRFEVGGGKCRDKTCDDLHVGDLEPSGTSHLHHGLTRSLFLARRRSYYDYFPPSR